MTTIESTPDQLLARAIAASQSDDSETALTLFAQASAAAPSWAVPQFLLGSEYASLGRMVLAEEAFANAVLLAPDFAIARYQLGLLQFSSGRTAMALVTWRPLHESTGTPPLQRFVNGFAELVQGQLDAALVSFREGVALNPDNAPLNGDVQKVMEEIEKLLAARSTDKRSADAQAATEPADGSHVLLSNYLRNEQLH